METVIFLFIERFYRSIAQIVRFCEFFHPGLQKIYFWLKITFLHVVQHVVLMPLLPLPKNSKLFSQNTISNIKGVRGHQ